jgi:2'-5' RNA ligase superfamily
MRNLLVVNYPNISADDFAWIQEIRQQEDELNFRAIDPHFTFVFPIIEIDRATLVSHIKRVFKREASLLSETLRERDTPTPTSHGIQPFDFTIRCAVLCNDAFSKYTHVFLVPDEGYSNIVKLHDRLYTEIIANKLRLDIPFIPHIGIANSLDPYHCKQLVDRLNSQEFEIRGRIDRLDIISSQGDLVETVESINLR